MKTIFVGLFLLSIIVLSSAQVIQGSKLQAVGGYSEVRQDMLSSLRGEQSFVRSEELARKAYQETRHGNLGQLHKVYQQVVAGVNYKMVFETSEGLMEVTVFCQPWTNTYEILSIEPCIIQN